MFLFGSGICLKVLVGLFPNILFVQVSLLQAMFFSIHKMLGLYRRWDTQGRQQILITTELIQWFTLVYFIINHFESLIMKKDHGKALPSIWIQIIEKLSNFPAYSIFLLYNRKVTLSFKLGVLYFTLRKIVEVAKFREFTVLFSVPESYSLSSCLPVKACFIISIRHSIQTTWLQIKYFFSWRPTLSLLYYEVKVSKD